MADPIKRFKELKAEAKRLRTERDRAAGALDRVKAELKEGFGVSTAKAAAKLLDELKEREASERKQLSDALDAFEKKWGE